MKASERDALLLLLAMGSGSADGWSFFGMGHAFVANMTGNTVLAGIAIFHTPTGLVRPLVALGGYLAGTAIGAVLNRNVRQEALWARSVSWTLLLESLLLFTAEGEWARAHSHPGPEMEIAMLACVAVAVGMQSGALIQLRIPGVITTYITGTWTTLVRGLTLLATRQPRSKRDRTKLEERFELQAAVLGFYILAAALSGWTFRYQPELVGAVPATAVLLAGAYGAIRY